MRKSLVVVVAAVLGLGLTSCSSEDKPTSATSPSVTPAPSTPPVDSTQRTAAAASQTVRDYIDAFFGGETERACALMTKAYQDENIKDGKDFGIKADATCPEAMKVGIQFAQSIKVTADDFKVGTATVKGKKAKVAVKTDKGLNDSTYTLTWNGSRWLVASDGTSHDR